MLFEIFVIVILLLLNAFFALSEFAIVSSNKYKLRDMVKQGHRRAKMALKLVEEPGKFLSTVQTGITLVGILAGAYGGATIAEKFEPYFNSIFWINPRGEIISVILVVMVITYFSVVVGELLPKQMALANPEKLAVRVAHIMNLISKIFSPLVWLFESSSNILMQLFGVINSGKKITEDGVKAAIDEGVESGAIEKEEHEMLQRIIRLGDRSVKSIMSHRSEVTFLDYNDDLESIKAKVHKSQHTRYPVIDFKSRKIEGVIQTKDILDAALTGKLSDIKSFIKAPTILLETINCLEVLKIFKTSPTHLVVVVDEYGEVQGIATLFDILEAIVGAVSSHYSAEKPPHIRLRNDNSWLIDGITAIDEIHLEIGIEEIEIEHETIAGFIIHTLGREPKEGDVIEKFGYNFEVIDMDDYRIDKVLVSRCSE